MVYDDALVATLAAAMRVVAAAAAEYPRDCGRALLEVAEAAAAGARAPAVAVQAWDLAANQFAVAGDDYAFARAHFDSAVFSAGQQRWEAARQGLQALHDHDHQGVCVWVEDSVLRIVWCPCGWLVWLCMPRVAHVFFFFFFPSREKIRRFRARLTCCESLSSPHTSPGYGGHAFVVLLFLCACGRGVVRRVFVRALDSWRDMSMLRLAHRGI